MNPLTNSLVWKGATEDGRNLLLTDAALKKIVDSLPEEPQLKALVKSNFNGNLKGAIARSIQQLTQNARYAGNLRCNKSGKRYQVFAADIGAQNYQIFTQPLDSKHNLIIAIRSQTTDSNIQEESRRGHSRVQVAIDNYLHGQGIDPRWGKAQVHSKSNSVNRQNKPDISYVDRSGQRVNIEIDTSDKRSHLHDKNQTWDPGAKHIYYVVGPESGKVISKRTWDPVKNKWDDKKYANQGVHLSNVVRGIEGKPTPPPPPKMPPTNRRTKASREAELYGFEEYRYV
jgi:hypothetical protein